MLVKNLQTILVTDLIAPAAASQPVSSHRVHQTDLSRAPPGLGLGGAGLEGGEAGSSWQGDVADIGRLLGGNTWRGRES